jgi:4-hydroxybenzoate polyprenyltransferase
MTANAGLATVTPSWMALARALRPYQWPKNAFVFAALAFSAGDSWQLDEPGSWWPLLWRTLLLFALWCMAASATYLVNDLRDREADRLHPRKRTRPIPSGAVSTQAALSAAAVLALVAIPSAMLLDFGAGALLAGYVVLMWGYSFGLRSVAVLDVLILSSGVILRAVAGATVIDVDISPWLYVCSSAGALFFASSKRWAEFRELGADAARHRPSLVGYTQDLLNQMLTISAAAMLLSYALYTIESVNVPRDGSMALTVPFVVFALFRYLLLLGGQRREDAPDQILFTDPQIAIAVFGFVVTAVAVLSMG